jgi:hypothetical protein
MEEWRAARTAELAAERALGIGLQEETALECEWPVPWDVGAPSVRVLASSWDVFLLYEPRDEGGVVVVQFVWLGRRRAAEL